MNAEIGGRYRIVKELGGGGFGRVFLAHDLVLGKHWAVKVLPAGDAAAAEEIRMLKTLSHPRLPRIVDVLEEGNRRYVIMDYVEGSTLEDLRKKKGRLPERLVLRWGVQLAGVLEYLHGRTPPVIYRDLKPENVVLRGSGEIILLDLGSAEDGRGGRALIQYGTPGYAAPEQFGEFGRADARSDLYSLGMTMLALLTGSDVKGKSPAELLRGLGGSISDDLRLVLLKATKRRPSLRYQSAADFRDALESCQDRRSAGIAVKLRHGAAAAFLAMVGSLLLLAGKVCRETLIEEIAGNYALLLNKASEASLDSEDPSAYYQAAIELQPARREAYIQYLDYMVRRHAAGEGLRSVCARIAPSGTDTDGLLLMRIGELAFSGDEESGLLPDYTLAEQYFRAAEAAGAGEAAGYADLALALSSRDGASADWEGADRIMCGLAGRAREITDPMVRLKDTLPLAELYTEKRKQFEEHGIPASRRAMDILLAELDAVGTELPEGNEGNLMGSAAQEAQAGHYRRRILMDLAGICLSAEPSSGEYNPDLACEWYGQLREMASEPGEEERFRMYQAEAAALGSDPGKAEELFEELCRDLPSARVYFRYALWLLDRGDKKGAEAFYEQGCAMDGAEAESACAVLKRRLGKEEGDGQTFSKKADMRYRP